MTKAVAKKLHKVDVDVKLLHSSQDSEHGEFLIQEKNKTKYHQDTIADDIDMILSNGLLFKTNYLPMLSSLFPLSFATLEPKISSQLFCRAFPFHVLFDRNLSIKQVGNSLERILPASTRPDCKVTDILRMVSDISPIIHFNTSRLSNTGNLGGCYRSNISTDQSRISCIIIK